MTPTAPVRSSRYPRGNARANGARDPRRQVPHGRREQAEELLEATLAERDAVAEELAAAKPSKEPKQPSGRSTLRAEEAESESATATAVRPPRLLLPGRRSRWSRAPRRPRRSPRPGVLAARRPSTFAGRRSRERADRRGRTDSRGPRPRGPRPFPTRGRSCAGVPAAAPRSPERSPRQGPHRRRRRRRERRAGDAGGVHQARVRRVGGAGALGATRAVDLSNALAGPGVGSSVYEQMAREGPETPSHPTPDCSAIESRYAAAARAGSTAAPCAGPRRRRRGDPTGTTTRESTIAARRPRRNRAVGYAGAAASSPPRATPVKPSSATTPAAAGFEPSTSSGSPMRFRSTPEGKNGATPSAAYVEAAENMRRSLRGSAPRARRRISS